MKLHLPIAAGALAFAMLAAPVGANAQSRPTVSPEASAALQQSNADQEPETTSDNLFWYRIQPFSHDPFVNDPKSTTKALNIVKHMVHFEHSDTGGLIWNSLTVTGLLANTAEPGGSPAWANTTMGSREVYMTYRGDIEMRALGLPRLWIPGVIQGTMLVIGGDLNWKDDGYQSRRKFAVAGPIFYLDLPGSVTFAVHVAQEWNHDGVCVPNFTSTAPWCGGANTHYHPTWNTELSLTEYLTDSHIFRWEAVWNMTGPKGMDSKLSKTVTEVYTYNQIVVDVGALLDKPPGMLDAFAGVQFWYNKFGYPFQGHPYGIAGVAAGGGALELTPYFGVGVHF